MGLQINNLIKAAKARAQGAGLLLLYVWRVLRSGGPALVGLHQVLGDALEETEKRRQSEDTD